MAKRVLKRVPPKWAEIHRRSLGALVREEAEALEELRKAVRLTTADLSDAISEIPESRMADEATRLLRHFSTVLQERFRQALLDAKVSAREAAMERFQKELEKLHSELRARDVHILPDIDLDVSDDDRDHVESDVAAASYRANWAAYILATILRWDPDSKKDLSVAVLEAPRKTDKRIRRIAATEVSRSYNRQHEEAEEALHEQAKDTSWMPIVVKRWDATLDAKVCETCREHDGEVVPLGVDYSDGDSPGDVHPNCRCSATILVIPVPLDETKTEEIEEAA